MSLVVSISIENLLAQRDAIAERLARMQAMAGEIDELASTFAQAKAEDLLVDQCGRGYYAGPLVDGQRGMSLMLKRLDASGWQKLLAESGLRTFMDGTARADWESRLKRLDVIPLTRENIKLTFGALQEARGALFERGVIACFRRLSWNYKTNLPQKFGKRIIVSGITTWGDYPDHKACNELDDLVRCFCILDGQPQPDHRQGMYPTLSAAMKGPGNQLQLTYFHIRWFMGTKTAHITFSRPDLMERMNGILAKHFPKALFDGTGRS